MIKYLHWKWYDWLTLIPMTIWVIVVTMIMSPAIMVEYMIMMVGRSIRENRFYERHDFGEVLNMSGLDDLDRQFLEEDEEKHVFGNFLYRSKMTNIWSTLISFRTGNLR